MIISEKIIKKSIIKHFNMPDITMCYGQNCPYKEQCYRYTAKPSELQSYFIDAPIKDSKCDYYWGENSKIIWNQLNDIVRSSQTENK